MPLVLHHSLDALDSSGAPFLHLVSLGSFGLRATGTQHVHLVLFGNRRRLEQFQVLDLLFCTAIKASLFHVGRDVNLLL